MAPPDWAYQVENFDPTPDDELVCSICRCVFLDPVQSSCNHVFCRTCITKWLENNHNCPICRKRATRVSLQDVIPLIKNMIMKLTLICHNKEKGCDEKFSLESCEAHVRACKFETVRCKNRPCKEMILRKDKEDHELKNCPHRYVKCKTCCMKISSNTPGKHNCILALKEELKSKTETIRKKNKKIKALEQKIKTIKEAEYSVSSSASSLGSLSAADIMINLSSMSPASYSYDSYFATSDDDEIDLTVENDDSYWMSTSEILNGLENSYNRMRENNRSQDDLAAASGGGDSIEQPREATAAEGNDSSVLVVDPLDSSLEAEPSRRPAKRPVRVLNFSDEDDDDMDVSNIPLPKRNWSLFRRDGDARSSGLQRQSDASSDTHSSGSPGGASNAAVPSTSSANAASTSTGNDTGPVPNSQVPFKVRPTLRSDKDTKTSTPKGSGMFQRTLNLLQRSNLESETEWIDVQSDSSSDSDYRPQIEPTLSISDSSSTSDDDSSDSSFDVTCKSSYTGSRRLARFDTSSSDDPDWMPPDSSHLL